MKRIFQLISSFLAMALLLMASGCEPSDPNADVAHLQLDLDMQRTDLQLAQAAEALPDSGSDQFFPVYKTYLQDQRDFWFYFAGLDLINEDLQGRGEPPIPQPMVDSVIAYRLGPLLQDSAFRWLLDTVKLVFPPESSLIAEELSPLFKRYHLLFPEVALPAIRTHVNGYDPSGYPQNVDQVLATPSHLSIGLHYFMGKDFPYYSPNLPQYIRRRFEKASMAPIVAHELAEGTVAPVPPRQQPSLLDKMIREGIKLSLVERLLPHYPDSMLIFYRAREMAWAQRFEQDIYKDLSPDLFSTDFLKHQTYLSERPFTGEIAAGSAPRLGEFIGWQVVRAYLDKNPNISMAQLVTTQDFEALFKASAYKP
jgi:uncharacterized protein YjaZ